MKRVYICCKYSFKRSENLHKDLYCRLAYDAGCFPIHAHSYLRSFLDYSNTAERRKGFKIAHETILRCSEVWVFGIENKQMLDEIAIAKEANKKIRYFDNRGNPL